MYMTMKYRKNVPKYSKQKILYFPMKFVINKTRIKTFCIFYNLYKAFQLKINVPKFRLDVTLQDLL